MEKKIKINKIIYQRTLITLISLLFACNLAIGQSLQHPHIWVTASDKQEILDNIDNYEWASSFYMQLKNRVDSKKNTHITNPSAILNTIPSIPGVGSDRSKHTDILTSASEAAILYYLTDDEDYAQLAADILHHYTKRLAIVDSSKIRKGDGIMFDDVWLEGRILFPKIPFTYDMVYDFVNNTENKVYDLSSHSQVQFNNSTAQTTVKKLAAILLKSTTASRSNHSLLSGNGTLFNILMIDDDVVRESFFRRYFYDPNGHPFDAFQWSLGNFTPVINVWPETLGYGKGSQSIVIQTLNTIDRYKPELNIVNTNLRILDGYKIYENFYYPNGSVLRFGDTGTSANLKDGYQSILKFADRRNLTEYVRETKQALKYHYDLEGGYNPKVETNSLEWNNPLQLLWGVHVDDTVTAKAPNLASTLHIDHAGIVVQRNYNTADIEKNGMMYYSGGATYVHSHSSGIDLELYGNGYVLGAESGSGSYGSDEHENYRVRIAAHNTVVANGSGKRGSGWGGRMKNVNLIAAEPVSEGTPISSFYSFSTQEIDDIYNNCLQQRTNSIIRTSPTSAYYFDIFRSRGNTSNNYHDYIYHNIGDAVALKYADNTSLALTSSSKYANDLSGSVTGWKFFENVKSSAKTNKGVNAEFVLNSVNTKMKVLMPAGIDREYATALSPSTKGAAVGYSNKKTPLFTIRQSGEAWNRAFVAIFEPSALTETTVQSVQNIEIDGLVVGAEVVSNIDGVEIRDYIIALDKEDSIFLPEYFISFKGRFGIVRKEAQSETTETITLYIGNGEKLSYADSELLGDAENKNVKTFYGVQKLTPETRFTVTTQVLGGGGTISKSPDQTDYVPGSQVVVIANPDLGNVVDTWLGNAQGSASTDTLTLFSDKNVFVRFREGEYFTLNVTTEHGTVTKSEQGTEFIEGTCIDLTAVPAEGYAFESWSGDVSSTNNPLTACVNSNLNITANFKQGTSLSEVLTNSIVVSPNPSTGVFNVNVQQVSNWLVYDVAGKLLESGSANGSFELDLTSYKKSIYILSIRTNNGVAVKRLIVK